jgi:chromosome segregation ATPase
MVSWIFGLNKITKIAPILMIVFLVLATGYTIYSFWESYNETKARIEVLSAELGKKQTELETSNAQIDKLRESLVKKSQSVENMEARLNDLARQYQESRNYSNNLERVLAEHDFKYLAIEKPGLIERRINTATARLLANIEQTTLRAGAGSGY